MFPSWVAFRCQSEVCRVSAFPVPVGSSTRELPGLQGLGFDNSGLETGQAETRWAHRGGEPLVLQLEPRAIRPANHFYIRKPYSLKGRGVGKAGLLKHGGV